MHFVKHALLVGGRPASRCRPARWPQIIATHAAHLAAPERPGQLDRRSGNSRAGWIARQEPRRIGRPGDQPSATTRQVEMVGLFGLDSPDPCARVGAGSFATGADAARPVTRCGSSRPGPSASSACPWSTSTSSLPTLRRDAWRKRSARNPSAAWTGISPDLYWTSLSSNPSSIAATRSKWRSAVHSAAPAVCAATAISRSVSGSA